MNGGLLFQKHRLVVCLGTSLRHYGFAASRHYNIAATINETAFLPQNTQSFFQITHIHCYCPSTIAVVGKQYPYVTLVAFVIMPDHTHALINILHDKNPESTVKKHSILELIGAYKTTSSKLIHLAGCSLFKWQRSYYMTLIYKQEQIDNIIEYINNNAAKWYASKKNSYIKKALLSPDGKAQSENLIYV